MRERLLKIGVWVGATGMVTCVAVLLAAFIVASVRAPKDDAAIKALEEQVKQDASLAPRLESEKDRVTRFGLLRRRAGHVGGWVLLIASAMFLTCSRLRLPSAPPPPRIKVQSARKSTRKQRTPRAVHASELNLSFVDRIVEEIGRTREVAIPLLQAIQAHYRYLPDEALKRLCELTEITPAEIAGTSSFYGQFRRSPVGEHIVRVCHGTACHVSGARQVTDEIRRYLAMPEGADTDAERQFTIEEVACLGCCSLAPVLMVDDRTAGKLTPASAPDALTPFEKETA